jgi:hypothetical protein
MSIGSVSFVKVLVRKKFAHVDYSDLLSSWKIATADFEFFFRFVLNVRKTLF